MTNQKIKRKSQVVRELVKGEREIHKIISEKQRKRQVINSVSLIVNHSKETKMNKIHEES